MLLSSGSVKTEFYTHVTKNRIISPLDNLNLENDERNEK